MSIPLAPVSDQKRDIFPSASRNGSLLWSLQSPSGGNRRTLNFTSLPVNNCIMVAYFYTNLFLVDIGICPWPPPSIIPRLNHWYRSHHSPSFPVLLPWVEWYHNVTILEWCLPSCLKWCHIKQTLSENVLNRNSWFWLCDQNRDTVDMLKIVDVFFPIFSWLTQQSNQTFLQVCCFMYMIDNKKNTATNLSALLEDPLQWQPSLSSNIWKACALRTTLGNQRGCCFGLLRK